MHMKIKSQIKAQSYWIKEETAFFPYHYPPKYVRFYISTVSLLKRRRKNPNDRKDMKGTEYHWTLMLK